MAQGAVASLSKCRLEMKMIKWIFITEIVLIGIFDYLLILGCAKLERERENDERSRQISDR